MTKGTWNSKVYYYISFPKSISLLKVQKKKKKKKKKKKNTPRALEIDAHNHIYSETIWPRVLASVYFTSKGILPPEGEGKAIEINHHFLTNNV